MRFDIYKAFMVLMTLSILTSGNLLSAQSTTSSSKTTMTDKTKTHPKSIRAQNKSTKISCKLTTPEMQKRKKTVISSLKRQILSKKELENGYAFKFPGTDKILDELTEFIKTERACCNFFVFGLSISGDKNETWLEMTGTEEAKGFILLELGL